MKLKIFKLQLLQLEDFVFFGKELGLSGNGTDETETEVRIGWGARGQGLGDGLAQKNLRKLTAGSPKMEVEGSSSRLFGPGV